MQREMGEDLGEEFDEMMGQMESGQMPEELASEELPGEEE